MNSTPTVKEIKPINFLCFRTETTMSELGKFVETSQKIIHEAVDNNIPVTGAIQWQYFGFTDFAKPFTLEITLPIGKMLNNYKGEFLFRRSKLFKCVCLTHNGSWMEFGKSYDTVMKFISTNNLSPSGESREIYINVDFENPEANITEIQIGIL